MPVFFRQKVWRDVVFTPQFAFFLSAVAAWPIMAELELFEEFYEYSRAHEDWDLDELALLIVNLTIALFFSVLHKSRALRKAVREREHEHKRAERNARHDPLTGLMNRRAFAQALEEMEKTIGKDGHFIAMLDLDRFKPVNDHQGHAAGDAILREVARRLEQVAGSQNTVARLGGDEFAVLFNTESHYSNVERISRRMLHAIEETFRVEGRDIHISCSIGLVNWTRQMRSADALGRADKALYTAKNQGRARFAWYDSELDRQSTERAAIETELRQAIKTSQIEPWFQPIIEIDSQSITGFEVLARWNHPERGAISPTVFIEIAEDSGQIGALGNSLLRGACMAASHWDPRLSISFNISALQFHDPLLVRDIESILGEFNFDPNRLTIEVTEHSVIRDFDAAREKLTALKALGIAVALDDFGTGYSSLASLRQLPFDRIKIDRSFVTNIGTQPQNQKIVSGIISLARGLELDVTAEGIESLDDLEFLQSLSCPLGQGFLFNKAVSADEAGWLLESKWSELRFEVSEHDMDATAERNKAG